MSTSILDTREAPLRGSSTNRSRLPLSYPSVRTFTVVASSPQGDLVVLEIARGPPARIFLPRGPCEPISEICFSQLWLARFGIAVTMKFVHNSIDINVGPSVDDARVAVLCQRHFAYEAPGKVTQAEPSSTSVGS